MSDKETKKTKAEMYEMLAQAVRNTQLQPVLRDAQPAPVHKTRHAPKRTAKIKRVRS